MSYLILAAPYAFAGLALLACGVAALLGGREGKWIAFLYLAAVAATHVATRVAWRWSSPNYVVFAIDALLLVGMYMVALRSQRYWPLWLTGLHLLTVCAHISAIIAPSFQFRFYFVLEALWSLPKMAILLIGVLIDWQTDHEARSPTNSSTQF